MISSAFHAIGRRIAADRFDILGAAVFASPFSLMLLIVALHSGALPAAMPAWLFVVYQIPLVVTSATLSYVVVGAACVAFQNLVARVRNVRRAA